MATTCEIVLQGNRCRSTDLDGCETDTSQAEASNQFHECALNIRLGTIDSFLPAGKVI